MEAYTDSTGNQSPHCKYVVHLHVRLPAFALPIRLLCSTHSVVCPALQSLCVRLVFLCSSLCLVSDLTVLAQCHVLVLSMIIRFL